MKTILIHNKPLLEMTVGLENVIIKQESIFEEDLCHTPVHLPVAIKEEVKPFGIKPFITGVDAAYMSCPVTKELTRLLNCTVIAHRLKAKQLIRYAGIHLPLAAHNLFSKKKQLKWESCTLNSSCTSSISEHMRIEIGKAPFKCLMCQRGFYSKRVLGIHAKTHMM